MKLLAAGAAVLATTVTFSAFGPQEGFSVESLTVNLIFGLTLVGSAFGGGFVAGRYVGRREERNTVMMEELVELRDELRTLRRTNP